MDETRPSSSSPEGSNGVVAVITALNPPVDLPHRVESLQSQVDLVIIVDDGSRSESSSDIFLELDRIGAQVLHHEENSGIAAALNTGVRAALAHDAKTVLTLDQDSTLAADYVQQCLDSLQKAAMAGRRVGFVCAQRMNGIDVPAFKGRNGIEPYDPMQSGMLIPVETFNRVGLFEEALFIDAVDSEFTLRVRHAGWTVEFAEGTDLEHGLGEQTPKTLFGRTLTREGAPVFFAAHSPIRLYYVTRNRIITNARYARHYPSWVLHRVVDDAVFASRNVVFGPAKWKSAKAIAHGFADGIRRRNGKISPQKSLKLSAKRK
ncbi:glycosyltransferase [Sinomonas terrae]|uniref:Glycosyltransferase n=1 Tax=Sinomonas terrae TaxID=2908838 RepID=A0ABS9TZ76_9MICC|nr:glycosyltransferase [Sinomonas terrae]MCH6469673.1 glycosyltransferase [Sinomonas terrae]